MKMNKISLKRRIQDSEARPEERQQLLNLVDKAADDNASMEALERRVTASIGGSTKSFNTKVPKNIKTK